MQFYKKIIKAILGELACNKDYKEFRENGYKYKGTTLSGLYSSISL